MKLYFLLRRSSMCVTPGFIRGKVNLVATMNSVGVSLSSCINLMLDYPAGVKSLLYRHPPDKSGGYAQKTLTEF